MTLRKKPRPIDFVGPTDGFWSISVVNRTVIRSLERCGFNIRTVGLQRRFGPARDIVFFGYVDHIRRYLMGKFNVGWVVFETSPIPAYYREVCKKLDLLLVPSEFVKQLCVESGLDESKIEVFPHCVDMEELKPAPRATGNSFRFLNIGMDHVKQGRKLLLEAYLSEFGADEKVKLTIKASRLPVKVKRKDPFPYDSLPAEALLREVQAKLRKSDYPKVEILREDRESLASLYQDSDCYVSPLFSNGFALTVLESMAAGRPTIVPRYGGLLDYCTDENSLLVDIEEMIAARDQQYYSDLCDPTLGFFALPSLRDLRKKMRGAFENPQATAALGRAARRDVERKYSFEGNADCLADIVNKKFPKEVFSPIELGAPVFSP